jgi:cobalt-precorrin 5A hydrolase/precorrin-3B C17-methyltransferase
MAIEAKRIIFYLTENGWHTAQRLDQFYPKAQILKFKPNDLDEIWRNSNSLIFIMASGIVVRCISRLIKDKRTDPAVVVIDDAGKFVISLLSGHIGGANKLAVEIARHLDGQAVITTASDVNNIPSLDLWAKENNLEIENWSILSHISTKFLNAGSLRVYSDKDMKLPDGFLRESKPEIADVLITNRKLDIDINEQKEDIPLYVRPKNLIIGIGCNSNTSEEEIEQAVKKTLMANKLSFMSIHSIATINHKGSEPGLTAFTEKYNFKLNTFSPDELNQVKGIPKSEIVYKSTGANAVAAPAALLASGADKLLLPKQKTGNVTIAVAELISKPEAQKGKLYIIGTGPGSPEHITPCAEKAIYESEIIVGYDKYIYQIQGLLKGKEVISTKMTQEVKRCKTALKLAASGKTVAVVCGGDPGIYAMAGLIFELLHAEEERAESENSASDTITYPFSGLEVEVIPGISALNACAARLGAPLMNDFVSISLSDRLIPWEVIEKRLEAAAMGDFVIILYNPKSMGRTKHIALARDIILKHRPPDTPIGIVMAAMRKNEQITITDLKNMLKHDIDMQTTVIIGNSQSMVYKNRMITRRGYKI